MAKKDVVQPTKTLIATRGWHKENIVDIDQLKSLESASVRSPRFKPIPHSEILQAFRDRAKTNGLELVDEIGKLKLDGKRYMYNAIIRSKVDPDYALALGFVSHNDGSSRFKGLLGSRVFMCENQVFHGVVVPSQIRHTVNNYDKIGDKIDIIFDEFAKSKSKIGDEINLLRNTPLTEEMLGKYILRLMRTKMIGNTHMFDIAREVEKPTLNKANDNSMWRVANAASYVVTHLIKNPASQATMSRVTHETLMKLVDPDWIQIGNESILKVTDEANEEDAVLEPAD